MSSDGQATLGEFDGDDGDDLDALRADVDRLTDLVNTLAENQQDLADAVEGTLADAPTDAGGPVDAVEDPRGFQ
ncbi:hypothetical protein [Haloarcula laminariae]|uniref:hypothetical protein n=1 Tax=Haloarcula laminariae TaxID=2961577 RepID=UPI0021CA68EA|nr:hypothetical protein [Halomicroarcula laminariae]